MMKKTMKAAIIQPPPSFGNYNCCLPSDYVGVGLLAVSAYLEEKDVETRIFHFPIAEKKGISSARVFQEISLFNPDVCAIGMNWVHFSSGALEVAEKIRATMPQAKIVIGGQHGSFFAGEISSKYSALVDAIIVGEAETPLFNICVALKKYGEIRYDVPGVMKPGESSIESYGFVDELDTLPFQSFKKVWPGYDRPLAALSTMRGSCPRNCIYCLEGNQGIAWKGKRRLHSEEYIAGQAAAFAEEGKTVFTIQDQFSHRGDAGAVALSEEFAQKGIHMDEFNIFSEPGAYSIDGLKALSKISENLVTIDYGVETGSESVARNAGVLFKKDAFLSQLEDTVKAGLMPFTWWMVGLPGESQDTVEETREFIVSSMKLGAIPRWITPLVLFPQTRMATAASQYNVSPHFTSFEHFARFSREPGNEMGEYARLATHSNVSLSGKQAVEAVTSLKKTVIEHWGVLEEFYEARPGAGEKFRKIPKMLTSEKGDIFPKDSFF